jgi:thioredoxin-like negative regulator of GroEL
MPVRYIGTEQWGPQVETSKEPVLIEFMSQTCSICATMAPVLERIADKFAGQVKVFKVDVMREQSLAMRFGVQGTPTFLMLCRGKPIASMVGEIYPTLLERMASEAVQHGDGCAVKQTKVVFEVSGYG